MTPAFTGFTLICTGYSSLPERATGLPERATGLPERATGLPEQATGLPEQATGLPEQATGLPEQATGLPEQATGLPEQATGLPEQATERPTGTSSANWMAFRSLCAAGSTANKKPNLAQQRTAPRVTVAAFPVRSRLVRAGRCLTSVASFFAPPSQLPRHAPLSLSFGSLGL